jgi:hypothetical protein
MIDAGDAGLTSSVFPTTDRRQSLFRQKSFSNLIQVAQVMDRKSLAPRSQTPVWESKPRELPFREPVLTNHLSEKWDRTFSITLGQCLRWCGCVRNLQAQRNPNRRRPRVIEKLPFLDQQNGCAGCVWGGYRDIKSYVKLLFCKWLLIRKLWGTPSTIFLRAPPCKKNHIGKTPRLSGAWAQIGAAYLVRSTR